MTDLTTQSPPEIDEQLAEIWGRFYQAYDKVSRAQAQIDHLEGSDFRGRQRGTEAEIARAEDVREAALAAANLILLDAIPFNDEFDRRGGWTRAYLVDNVSGHLHKTRKCSTCFPTTQFHWVTELSGAPEDEIVAAAGETACTICFASAPVDVLSRPSTINSPNRAERDKARAERAAAKAVRQDATVLDPETGQVLFKTARGAMNAVSSDLGSLTWYGLTHPDAPQWQANVARIIAALVAKGAIEDGDAYYEQTLAKARKRTVSGQVKGQKEAELRGWTKQEWYVEEPIGAKF